MSVEVLNGIGSEIDILKFHKAHGSIDLLPETHSLVAGTALEQGS
jgi:hypothetical protein